MKKKAKPISSDRLALSEYKAMWLMVMFDLPVVTKEDRRDYRQFRDFLISEGFSMLQYSVYARYCDSEEKTKSFRGHVQKKLPFGGQVRVVAITDHQFAKMEVFYGKKKKKPEKKPPEFAFL